MIRRLFPVAAVLTALLSSVLIAPGLTSAPARAASYPKPALTHWAPKLVIPAGARSARFRSPWVSTPQPSTALIPTWNVGRMPSKTWLNVYVRVADGSTATRWKKVAVWRHAINRGTRRTFGRQADSLAYLDTDVIRAQSGRAFTRWQIQVVVKRKSPAVKSPVLRRVAAVTSTYTTKSAATSSTTMTRTVDLAVPTYSQMTHRGHYPKFGGGGQAWCSPTSTAMVLDYWGRGPKKSATAWATGVDRQVDHAARFTYDSSYRGTGTWPFNTAYASRQKTDALVHRLPNLRAVEKQIKRGVPVVASIAFARGALTGSPISATPGHLVVVRGFTATGDVIVNDPAGQTNGTVRRVYRRAEFERAWLGGSGGVVYLIAPRGRGLVF